MGSHIVQPAHNGRTVLEVLLTDSRGEHVEDIVPAIVVTDLDHWLIHKGVSFEHADVHMIPKVGAGTNVLEYIFHNTNTGKEVHLNEIHVESEVGDGTLEFFSEVTSDDMGTPEAMLNRNFKSPHTSLLTLGHTPTNVVTPNPAIRTWKITSAKKEVGTSGLGIDEYVLDENVKYLVRYTNTSSTTDDNATVLFSTLEPGLL